MSEVGQICIWEKQIKIECNESWSNSFPRPQTGSLLLRNTALTFPCTSGKVITSATSQNISASTPAGFASFAGTSVYCRARTSSLFQIFLIKYFCFPLAKVNDAMTYCFFFRFIFLYFIFFMGTVDKRRLSLSNNFSIINYCYSVMAVLILQLFTDRSNNQKYPFHQNSYALAALKSCSCSNLTVTKVTLWDSQPCVPTEQEKPFLGRLWVHLLPAASQKPILLSQNH